MKDEHKFWNEQPVEVGEGNEIIKKPFKIHNQSLVLPEGFTFESYTNAKEISKFLNENYVEDSSEEFRLQYSEAFIDWIIRSPNSCEDYSLALTFNNKLISYIFCREHELVVRNKSEKVSSVNFLCVSKDLRGKRIAPVLIKEITRRCNCNGIYQAIFSSGTNLFFNIAKASYYHRPLNVKKLININFLDEYDETKIDENRSITRPYKDGDLESIYEIYKNECKKYSLVDLMDINVFKHNVEPRKGVLNTYVTEENGAITSFASFFILDTLSIKCNQKIKTAYLYYHGGENMKDMIKDLLYFAKEEKFDVFNCIDIADASTFIEDLGFLKGDGCLNYYLYNWKTQNMKNEEIFFYFQ